MKDAERKRLLVLGGGTAALDVVKQAQKLGYYVVATDNLNGGVSKEIADASYQVSTVDIDGLKEIIEKERIDGVFSGPSEFNIINTMNLCEASGLPFYATREQWDICSNKESFKDLCRSFNVPCVEEYSIDNKWGMDFPVIVKPVDGNSSRGITVCYKSEEVDLAYENALAASDSSRAIIEKYVESAGVGINVRYISDGGRIRFVLAGDSYTVDPYERKALINAVGIYPSQHTDYYISGINDNVCKMFESLGIKDTTFFMQAVSDNKGVYFHEMGLRLSGGLLYSIIEPLTGFNDLKMMIRGAVGDPFATPEDIENIDPYMAGKIACIFSIPLKAGRLTEIGGLSEISDNLDIDSFIQYHFIGDVIEESYIGTLQQHFGRYKFHADSTEGICEKINYIQEKLCLKDQYGSDMIFKYFDTQRITDNRISF